jgi:hypothetical protein
MKRQVGFRRSRFAKSQREVVRDWRVTFSLRGFVMNLPTRLGTVGVGLLLLAAPVIAQTPGQRIVVEQSGGSPRQEGSVRVQTSINFFVSGPTGEGEEAQKLRDRARRTIYEMAARECDLLREVLARDCRMEAVNSNISRQFGQQQQEGFNINGSMNFQITLK